MKGQSNILIEQNKTAEMMTLREEPRGTRRPPGPKEGTPPWKHYQAAEKANTAKNDTETNKESTQRTHAARVISAV